MEEIVRYEDRDGQQITLTPQDVAQFCASGTGQLTQRDVVNFMATCRALGANPYTRDVYLVKYGNDGDAQIIAGKNYYTRVAAAMESFDGMRAGIVVIANDGGIEHREGTIVLPGETLAGGWAEVFDKRWKVPTRAEVALSEYNTGKSLWRSKPATMIRKVALVQALREAYPDRFAGTYDAAEMPEPQQAQAVEAEVSKPDNAPDDDWLRETTDRLAAMGYDHQQTFGWLRHQAEAGGMEAARRAAADMEAQAQPAEADEIEI